MSDLVGAIELGGTHVSSGRVDVARATLDPSGIRRFALAADASQKIDAVLDHIYALFLAGDWDETMAVVKRAVDAVAARAPRVSLVLKADIRPGVTGALTAKVEAVERYLQG